MLLEDKIQDWGMYLFKISYGRYAVDQRSWDGGISGRSQDVAVNWKAQIPKFRDAWCEDCVWSEEHHHKFLLQDESQSGWAKGANARPNSPWKTDWVKWSTNTSGWLENMKLFLILRIYSVSLHMATTSKIFDTIWDQALLSTSELPKDSMLESVYKMCMPESVQLQTGWQCTNEESIKIDRGRIIRSWKPWWETHGSNDQDAKFQSQKRKQEDWSRVRKGRMSALKGKRKNAINWKQNYRIQ